ncbi:hypothetical protein AB0I28_15350 [Phytomonospora sp. NPDC050363]|uniref:hypothetical protein n=1 Tax=Phytomonospora sp. NPDC050363 TaxID=3155642 RepID=UPI0033EAB776
MSDTLSRKRWGRLAVAVLGGGLALMAGGGGASANTASSVEAEREIEGAFRLSDPASAAGAGEEVVSLAGRLTAGDAGKSAEGAIPVTGLTLEGDSATYGKITVELVGEAEASLGAPAGAPPTMRGDLTVTVTVTLEKPGAGMAAEEELSGTFSATGITSPADLLDRTWKGELTPASAGAAPEAWYHVLGCIGSLGYMDCSSI